MLRFLFAQKELALTPEELNTRFDYHPPRTDETRIKHEQLRSAAKMLARRIIDTVPAGYEQTQAIARLEESLFWANAGIARRQ